jgi:Fe-S cluster biogenesis protein NfuA
MERSMSVSTEDRTERERMHRIEVLVQELERMPDSRAKTCAREIIHSILDLHAAALERILDTTADSGPSGLALIDTIAADELVGSLLALYGLHPIDLEARVRVVLEKVRPLLRSHGGNVELLGIAEGRVRLKLLGSCDGCPSSAMTLKHAIEAAIYEQAPDVAEIEVAGVTEAQTPAANFIPADQLICGNGRAHANTPAL